MQNSVNGCNYCTSSCNAVTSRFFAMNAPNPPHWTLNSCFGALHSVWVHLGSFRNYMKLDAKKVKLVQLMRKFLPRCHVGIFSTNAPNPPHWTLNSCFSALHSDWVHLGSFRNCMKLSAIQYVLVQIMQKYMKQNHVGIFFQLTRPLHSIGP